MAPSLAVIVQIVSMLPPVQGECPPKVTRPFCSQVSQEQYEQESKSSSDEAITALLDRIAADEGMAAKEKKTRLKLVSNGFNA